MMIWIENNNHDLRIKMTSQKIINMNNNGHGHGFKKE